MLGLPTFGLGDLGEISCGFAAGPTVATVAAQHATIGDIEANALIDNQSLWDDVVELDSLCR